VKDPCQPPSGQPAGTHCERKLTGTPRPPPRPLLQALGLAQLGTKLRAAWSAEDEARFALGMLDHLRPTRALRAAHLEHKTLFQLQARRRGRGSAPRGGGGGTPPPGRPLPGLAAAPSPTQPRPAPKPLCAETARTPHPCPPLAQAYYYNCWKLGGSPLAALFQEMQPFVRKPAAAPNRRAERAAAAARADAFEDAASRALLAAALERELAEARAVRGGLGGGAGGGLVGGGTASGSGGSAPREQTAVRRLQGVALSSGGSGGGARLQGVPLVPARLGGKRPPAHAEAPAAAAEESAGEAATKLSS
jgi:hypothetical protein